MKPELKPCPFCGNPDITLSNGETFRWRYVGCSECGAQIEFRSDCRFEPTDETWADAAETWNRRSQPSAEEVREACARVCKELRQHSDYRGNAVTRGGMILCEKAIRSLDLSALPGKETSK